MIFIDEIKNSQNSFLFKFDSENIKISCEITTENEILFHFHDLTISFGFLPINQWNFIAISQDFTVSPILTSVFFKHF